MRTQRSLENIEVKTMMYWVIWPQVLFDNSIGRNVRKKLDCKYKTNSQKIILNYCRHDNENV